MAKYLITIMTLSLLTFPAHATDTDTDIGTIINTCWQNHSHIEMSQCVESIASASGTDLQSAESSLLNHLSQSNEDKHYLARQQKTFQDAKKAFQIYLKKNCEFYAALAAGGNADEDFRLACTAVLNRERTNQLKWALQN